MLGIGLDRAEINLFFAFRPRPKRFVSITSSLTILDESHLHRTIPWRNCLSCVQSHNAMAPQPINLGKQLSGEAHGAEKTLKCTTHTLPPPHPTYSQSLFLHCGLTTFTFFDLHFSLPKAKRNRRQSLRGSAAASAIPPRGS